MKKREFVKLVMAKNIDQIQFHRDVKPAMEREL